MTMSTVTVVRLMDDEVEVGAADADAAACEAAAVTVTSVLADVGTTAGMKEAVVGV